MMFFDGGGVTLTGGELSLQKEPVISLLGKLKGNNIHTCIETNASLADCRELFDMVDYMIADFKSPFADKLSCVTGADIEVIKDNLLYRASTHKPLLVRATLINGFNTGKDNAIAFADFFEKLQRESGSDTLFFEILTYHEYGKDKYEKLNKEYTINDGYVNEEDILTLSQEIQKRGLKLINT